MPRINNEKIENKQSKQDLIKAFKAISKNSSKKTIIGLIIAVILLTVCVVLQITSPQFLKDLTNLISEHSISQDVDMEKVNRFTIILSIMYISIAFCNYIANFLFTTFAYNYTRDLRTLIANKINKVPLKFFDSTPIGEILSRLTNDVDTIGTSLQQSLGMFIQGILLLIGVLIAMFITSWKMAFAALASLPLMLILLVVVFKFGMPQFRKRQSDLGKVNSIVEENYNAQIVIKLFNADEKVNKEFNEKNLQLKSSLYKSEIFTGLMMPLMMFMSYFAYAMVFIVGGILLNDNNQVDIGTIMAFMTYVNLFQSPLTQIAQAVSQLQLVSAASNRVMNFLAEKEEIDDSSLPRRFPIVNNRIQVKGDVEFKNVSFGYSKDKIIIHNFSAKIDSGMKVAIVGPTGAGKTTLVNLLMRFYEIDKGDITIDGISIKDISKKELHDIFGMVLQDTWLFDGTFKENIVYNTNDVSDKLLELITEETELYHYINTQDNGFDHEISDSSSISQGQKQLITISRAMLKNSPMMILDEATSNVDTRTEEVIQKSMDLLTKNRTSFVIAHRLSTIKNASLILVMKDGNIIEQGNHEQLMKQNGFYASLYNSQFTFE